MNDLLEHYSSRIPAPLKLLSNSVAGSLCIRKPCEMIVYLFCSTKLWKWPWLLIYFMQKWSAAVLLRSWKLRSLCWLFQPYSCLLMSISLPLRKKSFTALWVLRLLRAGYSFVMRTFAKSIKATALLTKQKKQQLWLKFSTTTCSWPESRIVFRNVSAIHACCPSFPQTPSASSTNKSI